MAKFEVTYGTAGVPARFWDRKILDESIPKEKQELDEARARKRPIKEVV
jgi:hypothetical protein